MSNPGDTTEIFADAPTVPVIDQSTIETKHEIDVLQPPEKKKKTPDEIAAETEINRKKGIVADFLNAVGSDKGLTITKVEVSGRGAYISHEKNVSVQETYAETLKIVFGDNARVTTGTTCTIVNNQTWENLYNRLESTPS